MLRTQDTPSGDTTTKLITTLGQSDFSETKLLKIAKVQNCKI